MTVGNLFINSRWTGRTSCLPNAVRSRTEYPVLAHLVKDLGQIVFQVADSTKAGPLAVSRQAPGSDPPSSLPGSHLCNLVTCIPVDWRCFCCIGIVFLFGIASVAFLRGGRTCNLSQISVKHPPLPLCPANCIHPIPLLVGNT